MVREKEQGGRGKAEREVGEAQGGRGENVREEVNVYGESSLNYPSQKETRSKRGTSETTLESSTVTN